MIDKVARNVIDGDEGKVLLRPMGEEQKLPFPWAVSRAVMMASVRQWAQSRKRCVWCESASGLNGCLDIPLAQGYYVTIPLSDDDAEYDYPLLVNNEQIQLESPSRILEPVDDIFERRKNQTKDAMALYGVIHQWVGEPRKGILLTTFLIAADNTGSSQMGKTLYSIEPWTIDEAILRRVPKVVREHLEWWHGWIETELSKKNSKSEKFLLAWLRGGIPKIESATATKAVEPGLIQNIEEYFLLVLQEEVESWNNGKQRWQKMKPCTVAEREEWTKEEPMLPSVHSVWSKTYKKLKNMGIPSLRKPRTKAKEFRSKMPPEFSRDFGTDF